jgi:hypothetical protein
MHLQLLDLLVERPRSVRTCFSGRVRSHIHEVRGLFAGVSLDGSVVGMDDSANRKIYGQEVTGEQILLGTSVKSKPTVEPFLKELQKVSPPHVHEKKVTQKS